MKNKDDVIIIGAGIGGLTAGSLMAKMGRRVTVFESGDKPGGFAQNFKRAGFTFDASLHSMNGPRPESDMAEIVSECGIKDKVEFVEQHSLYRLIAPDFDIRVKNADMDAYAARLKELFPHESKGIDNLLSEATKVYDSVGRMSRSRLPYFLNVILFPLLYPKLVRYDRYTVGQFTGRFVKDEKLTAALSALWSFFSLPPDRLAFSYFFYPFVDYLKNGGYIVKGGSERLARAFVESIEESGGRVVTGSGVSGIITKGKRAIGVRTKDGEFFAGNVISNISPMKTVEMTGAEKFKAKYINSLGTKRVAMSGVQVYLGLDCTLGELGVDPDDYIIALMENYDLESQYQKCMANDLRNSGGGFGITCYGNMDSSMAPEGKSTVGLFSLSGGRQWMEMDETAYRENKAKAVEIMIEKAEKVIPGISRKIIVKEAATPRTMLRYTGNPLGSYHGFEQTVDQAGMLRRFSRKYPLKGLYHVGAWTFPGGGYGGVMFSARQLVKRYFS